MLSPLLFAIVMDALTENVSNGSLLEMIYADDLVSCVESIEEVMGKYEKWKEALEGKGREILRVCNFWMVKESDCKD